MKVSIIGGGGRVGSCAAFALQTGKVVREIALLDVNQDLAEGEALDLLHGGPSTADQVIHAGDYSDIPSSDVICITAGLRRQPDESRLDLINRNVDLFLNILADIKAAGTKPGAIVFVVSNPVDILTYLALDRLDLGPGQVLGLGTQLDTIRFRSLIAQYLGAPPTQCTALILGEHGDSMVPIWSSATLAGLPIDKYAGWKANSAAELFERTKGSGAEVIKRKGGAGWAVGIAIQDVIEAIALDKRQILPVSSRQNGCYDIHGVSISVPTIVGRGGVLGTHELDLWPIEMQGIRHSATVLGETLKTVLDRVG